MWIVAHGVESDAATLAWEKVDAAQCYEVQLKVGDGADDDFKTVSDKLSSTMVGRVLRLARCGSQRNCPVFAL